MIIIKISIKIKILAIIAAKQLGRFLTKFLILPQEQEQQEQDKTLQSQQLQSHVHIFSLQHCFMLENIGHIHL